MTGPWTDIEPMAAKRYSTGLLVANERWVSRRWKPIVTPKPVIRYMTPKRTRSCAPTPLPQNRSDGGEEGDERDDDGEQIRDSGGS